MPILVIGDGEIKEKEPLEAVKDSQRWNARCMHRDCDWRVEGLFSADAANTAAQLHWNTTRHPVNLRALIEFECGVVRSTRCVR